VPARITMTPEPDIAYRCPKCGATSALLLPERVLPSHDVALKCLQCAYVLRVPRHLLEGAGGGSTNSLE
jgi:hypothetical protein